jgi:S-adenosylmethionine:tRNA-ribosyltransferase-isomerase (queuine synthetase)
VQGVIHDERHGIVDVIAGKYIRRYEPFILASQAHQVCYVPHVTSKRKNDEYYMVLKIKARSYVEETKESNEELNELYQVENEQPPSVIVDEDLDDVSTIPLPSYIENEEDDDEDELEDDVEDVEEEDEEEDCGENFDED